MIPISNSWIQSHSQLKKWVQKNWIDKGISYPFMGGSGEGISSEGMSDDEFSKIKDVLLEMKQFVFNHGLEQVLNSEQNQRCPGEEINQIFKDDESLWLMNLDQNAFVNKERMIFIHDDLWDKEIAHWAEFIPIDQSLGCFSSSPLLSTMIHETNVNSGSWDFFPSDSHGLKEKEIPKEDLNELLKNDFGRFKAKLSREFQIQTIYISMILKLIQ